MSQSDEITRIIHTAKNTLAGSSKLLGRLMEGNERKKQLKEFEKIMADLCILGEEHKQVCTALEQVQDKLRSNRATQEEEDENANVDEGEASAENLSDTYRSELESLQGTSIDVTDHPDMFVFRTMLREVLSEDFGGGGDDDEDEDVVLTAAEVNIYDPFTRKVMVDPVKNIKCGHSYERASIEEMLKKGKVKCPYLSCPNRTEMRPLDLESDVKLKKYLETQKQSNDSDSHSVASVDD